MENPAGEPLPAKAAANAPDAAVQVVLSVDVEPDERLLDRARREAWRGTEYLFDGIGRIRADLARASGRPVAFTWHLRLDAQIERSCGDAGWPLSTFARDVAALAEAGDAFGIHPHAWRWDERRRSWVTDLSDPAWVEHCVRLSLDTYERHFGAPCRIFRFGDAWFDEATLDLIEGLGLLYDLTAEPGHGPDVRQPHWETVLGAQPDTRGMRPEPHWRQGRGNGGIWMVPVSTARLRIDRHGVAVADGEPPDAADVRERLAGASRAVMGIGPFHRLLTRSRQARNAYRRVGRFCLDMMTHEARTETVELNLTDPPAEYTCAFAHVLGRAEAPFVHTVLRSGDLARAGRRANFVRNLDFLVNHPGAGRFDIATPDVHSRRWQR